ncbi:hypothetical protein LTR36_009652 [Oleoguttula mirabilis]|uniref:Uncharacterized protein n=1 Tax=Oleoguttula mirabilis TaxID=1507867 RepID=A0AAV9J5F6_9PEZI|nr:hypothetical protein LTR36_009652 [Oleoguttula mirabilis]
MYRTSDPRFRRRLHEIGQTVETATEQAQSSLYIFGQHYVRPCFDSVGSCFTSCVDASCPALNLSQRDRLRRQRGRGRSRGRAELNFDFYDDWDDLDETDGLLGWGGNDDFDRLLAGSGAGYGTTAVAQQPGRQRGMSYPKARRKSAAQIEEDPTVIPGSKGFFGRLFGGKNALRYRPSAADLQEHPGARRIGRDITEGEALLEESETSSAAEARRTHRRARSGTVESRETIDSLSSRGDIFPSDEEVEDAIPLDDEFAMVLERRNTQSGPETEGSSARTRSIRRGKRPSTGSRASTRRTVSTRSARSSIGKKSASRRSSSSAQTPIEEDQSEMQEEVEVPSLSDLKQENVRVAHEQEAEVERKRQEAQKVATERGLEADSSGDELPSKEDTPQASTPVTTAVHPPDEPS